MPSIEARISNDLKFNESGEIGIKIDDSKDDNALALKSDGLFRMETSLDPTMDSWMVIMETCESVSQAVMIRGRTLTSPVS